MLPFQVKRSLHRGLVAYYRCEEASGSTRLDASGNSHTFSLVNGGPDRTTGAIGNCLSLTNTTTFSGLQITSGNATAFDFAGDFTITGIVKPSVLASNRTVIAKSNATGNQREWLFGYGSTSNVWRFQASANGTAVTTINCTDVTPSTGSFVFFACGLAGSTAWLRINNGTLFTAAFTGPVFPSSADLLVGANSVNQERYGGLIDEISIHSRALRREEIEELYRHFISGYTKHFSFST